MNGEIRAALPSAKETGEPTERLPFDRKNDNRLFILEETLYMDTIEEHLLGIHLHLEVHILSGTCTHGSHR
ncbi:hypothetical protein [Methanothermobacter sp.]|uniref:hypothetical protein n=1 Tax=Methanothermobacter sp. TaxID=1884223 RepID=UPI00262DA57B|nr:hypothetical protein [Methanothermobacter sp.]MDI9615546.1 hypothetical protein [Methanothermobacter sp.]